MNFDEGVAYGRGMWRASCSGGHLTTIEKPADTQAACNRAAREEAATRSSTAGCSMRREQNEEIRYCSNESDGRQHQASLDEEESEWADDTCLNLELLAHNCDQKTTFSHDLRNNYPPDDGHGGIEGRPCSRRCCCYGDDSKYCRTGASGETESGSLTDVQARTASQTTFPSKTATHADCAVQTDLRKEALPEGAHGTGLGTRRRSGASFEMDTSPYGYNISGDSASPRRHHTHSNKNCGDEEQGDVETARPGAPHLSNELRESNTNPCPRRVGTPHQMRQEDDGDGESDEDEETSCALARKRALLRVRLARQRDELATALVDANERGLRVERRRRREEKLVALLMKARRDSGVSCGGGGGCGAGNRRPDQLWFRGMSSSRGNSERRGRLMGARPVGESQSMRLFILSVG